MSEEATIRRGVRNARYTTVPNHVFEDARLSMEARWLLGYLLSKPDDWTVRLGDIRKKGGCGRDKARAMVTELVKTGYAEKEPARKDGKFNGLCLVIYDEPISSADASVASLPQPEKPSTVLPATANPPLVKTDVLATPESQIERERESEQEDRKTVEKAFERAWQAWPTSIGDSRPQAFTAWQALTPEEREQAAAEAVRYVAAAKATGRKMICAHAVYLREKRWQMLPAPVAEKRPEHVEARPFGKVWQVLRLQRLLDGPTMVAAGLSNFQRLMVENGQVTEADLLRERQSKMGWPAVNQMHEQAANRRAVTASSRLEAFADLMEPVPVGSAVYQAWKAEHEVRGWPWLPDPGGLPVVYFPAGGPERLEEFETAIRGNGHDGDRHEAAE